MVIMFSIEKIQSKIIVRTGERCNSTAGRGGTSAFSSALGLPSLAQDAALLAPRLSWLGGRPAPMSLPVALAPSAILPDSLESGRSVLSEPPCPGSTENERAEAKQNGSISPKVPHRRQSASALSPQPLVPAPDLVTENENKT